MLIEQCEEYLHMNDCDDKGLSSMIGNGSLIYEEVYKV